MTNASLTDSDLLAIMRAEEEHETVTEKTLASSAFQMSMNKKNAAMDAAKGFLKTMGFNDKKMLS